MLILGQLMKKAIIHIQLHGFSYRKSTSKKKLRLDLCFIFGCRGNIFVESSQIIRLLQ